MFEEVVISCFYFCHNLKNEWKKARISNFYFGSPMEMQYGNFLIWNMRECIICYKINYITYYRKLHWLMFWNENIYMWNDIINLLNFIVCDNIFLLKFKNFQIWNICFHILIFCFIGRMALHAHITCIATRGFWMFQKLIYKNKRMHSPFVCCS